MKKLRLILIIPAVLLMNFRLAPAELSSAERRTAMEYLTNTKEDLMRSIKGLSKEQMNFKINSDTWSVAECVEHIALAESNIFGMMQGTLKDAANPEKRKEIKLSDEDVFKNVADRTYKVKTGEPLTPAAKLGSNEATLKDFLAKRDANIHYVKNTTDDLRNHFFTFPVEALGTLDAYQLIIFMAGHSKRHILQIEEVKADATFPKK